MLLDDSVSVLEAAGVAIGGELDLLAYAGASDAEGSALSVPLDVSPLLPLAPVHLSAARDAATGDIALSWVRRGRVDADGWAAAAIPLDYSPEGYGVTILDGETEVRSLDVSQNAVAYAAADQTADFGGPATDFTLRVAQLSAVYGAGHPTERSFSL